MNEVKTKQKYQERGTLIYQAEQIQNFINEGKFRFAKQMIFDLLEKHPEDHQLKRLLGRCYVFEQEYDHAIEVFEQIQDVEHVYQNLAALYLKVNQPEQEEKLFRLYQTVFQRYPTDPTSKNASTQRSYRSLQVYLNKRYNPNYTLDTTKLCYSDKQCFSYDKALALEHIEKRHTGRILSSNSVFHEQIDLPILFEQVTNYIAKNQEKGTLRHNYCDHYTFFYPDCGTNYDGKNCDYITVFTLINQPLILSMYPCVYRHGVTILCHLEAEVQEKSCQKVKAKTGLERFQARYQK